MISNPPARSAFAGRTTKTFRITTKTGAGFAKDRFEEAAAFFWTP
jgi:hypothetical protein